MKNNYFMKKFDSVEISSQILTSDVGIILMIQYFGNINLNTIGRLDEVYYTTQIKEKY